MNSTFTFSDCFSTLFVFIGRGLGVDCDAFNWCLSKMRQCIERAFGLMVQRWGILWRSLRVTFSSMPKVLLAVARLHNFCITVKDTPPNTRYHGDWHEDDIFRVIMNRFGSCKNPQTRVWVVKKSPNSSLGMTQVCTFSRRFHPSPAVWG